jgi:Zn-dependent protease
MSKVLKFIKLPLARKCLVAKSVTCVACVKVALWILPFRTIVRHFRGCPGAKAATEPIPPQELLDIQWAIGAVSRAVPIGNVCLVTALAAKWMARNKGIPTTLYLGVKQDESRKLLFHAWLKYHDFVVTGGRPDGVYKTLDSFE